MSNSQLKGLQSKLSSLEQRVSDLSGGTRVSVATSSNNEAVDALFKQVKSLAEDLIKLKEDLKRHCIESRQIINNSIQTVKDTCKCVEFKAELEAKIAANECACKGMCDDAVSASDTGNEETQDNVEPTAPKKRGKKSQK